MCPYCGSNVWQNAWGRHNAQCAQPTCNAYFTVLSIDPPRTTPVEAVRPAFTPPEGFSILLLDDWPKPQEIRMEPGMFGEFVYNLD